MRSYWKLRALLNEQGIATCMKCGYDLRGCTENRCSECGTEFQPEKSDSKMETFRG